MEPENQPFTVSVAGLEHARTLSKLNRFLIEDERSTNDMDDFQLYQRMRTFLQGRYSGWIAHQGDNIAGYALTLPQGTTLYIRHFFIVRRFRRQGTGRRFMNWIIDHAGSSYARITLDVLSHNERGIAFWHSLGFDDLHIHMEIDLDERRRGSWGETG